LRNGLLLWWQKEKEKRIKKRKESRSENENENENEKKRKQKPSKEEKKKQNIGNLTTTSILVHTTEPTFRYPSPLLSGAN